jgi:putative acetyltransferase
MPTIAADDPRREDVRRLLATHLEFANAQSEPEDVHALDVDGLTDPSVSFFSARDEDGRLLAVGALKVLEGRHGELKSMHTTSAARGLGIGAAMVERLVVEAGSRGLDRVSLETGTMAAFAPARRLYERAGFEECEPFGDYRPSRASTFMTRRTAVR